MADKEPEKEPEKTPEPDNTDPWEKMGGLIRSVVKEELAGWQPQSPVSEKKESGEPEEKKTPERRKGFLEGFFQGLT